MLIQQSRQSLPSTAPFKGVIGLKRCNSRCARLKVYAQKDGRQPWNFMRFFQTLSFYNQIKGPQEIISSFLQGPQPQEKLGMRLLGDPSMSMESDVVLVVGATGGVGKRVVGELLKKGRKVRGLVRNYEKAQKLLAGLEATGNAVLEVVAADLTQRQTLQDDIFKGVESVINCCAVIVGPKDDTPEREKYYQGIKFYQPEIKKETPEEIEYKGIINLFSALSGRLGTLQGLPILSPEMPQEKVASQWGALDDVVMGGASESGFRASNTIGEDAGPGFLFSGVVSTDNSGGFASIRTKNFEPSFNLSSYDGIELRVKGNGQRFKLVIRDTDKWDTVGFTRSFDTSKDVWQSIRIPFDECIPVFRAKTVTDGTKLNTSNICSLQLMLSKFEYDGGLNPNFQPGPFSLPIQQIRAYSEKAVMPKFVSVGSAGVTRFNRPGIKAEEEFPLVRLNDQLGGILTYKLKGEDVIRQSGVPYAIVRPCALTEEPAGAPIEFDQGDVIMGKISREDIAQLCVYLLEEPSMVNVTFEIKSTVPVTTPFEVDPSNPPPPRDWATLLKDAKLKPGVTGKTVDGVYTGREVEVEAMSQQQASIS
eukprot:TRINITY_DN4720_c0_g1_i1.p1 TRINITY_DN4720_c0_g1~~TRINITY_DN4720_c0_g1_i1.p1  ORF type:complete len:619 (-),score=81.13 TRINITY_DN4720_c0_g1_i1:330-2102(-)